MTVAATCSDKACPTEPFRRGFSWAETIIVVKTNPAIRNFFIYIFLLVVSIAELLYFIACPAF
jgi:hypothetical protein